MASDFLSHKYIVRSIMESGKKESIPNEQAIPLRRFYLALERQGDNYADMVIAAERLVLEMGICNTKDEADELVAAELLLDADNALSEGERRDLFVTMPLRLATTYVDRTYDLRTVGAWYERLLAKVWQYTRDVHGPECLDSIYFAHSDRCDHSGHCPLIFTAKFMESSLFDTEFDQPKYDGDRLMAYEVAVIKERAAEKFGLRSAEQADSMIGYYQENFSAHFNRN